MSIVKFEHIPIKENGDPLVLLTEADFVLEPAYFIQGLSEDSNLYTRESIVTKLNDISLKLDDYRFKIWDTWRSRKVQNNIYQKFWADMSAVNPEWDEEKLRVEVGRFATIADDPNRIPPHSTGGSIDLTLIDKNGQEIDMGTGFDHLGPEASKLYFEEEGRDLLIQNNRRLLREVMESAGFRSDEDEWWHFDYGNQLWAAELGCDVAIYGEKVSAP